MKSRRHFVKQSSTALAYTALFGYLSSCKSGQEKRPALMLPADVPYKMSYLAGDVGYFTERGGTIGWMASKDGIVIVDTQFPDQSNNLLGEIKKLRDVKVDYLINTHHHGDHTAGNIVYKDLTENIVAHTNSKKNQKASAAKRGTEDKQLYPTTLFDKEYTCKVGKENIKLRYFGAAHTDGDIIVHFEDTNVVHMGDLIFNRRFPYIDKSAGANIENWISVLDKTETTFNPNTKYMFGHSDNGYEVTGGIEDIKAFKNYLEKLLVFGQESIKNGMTLDDAKATVTSIPGAPEWKGKGIERSLDAVYQELAS